MGEKKVRPGGGGCAIVLDVSAKSIKKLSTVYPLLLQKRKTTFFDFFFKSLLIIG